MAAIGNILNTNSVSPPPVTQLTPSTPASNSGGLSFGDVLDAVNPLQHIPGVSSLYRAITGNQISPASQIAGDTLYGAVTGGTSALISFAASSADVAVKQITGTNIAQHVVAAVNSVTNAVTPSSGTGTQTAATALVPNVNAVAPAAPTPDPTKLSTQLANATHAIYHSDAHIHSTNARYQRAQAFDAINKHLVKMAI